MSEYSNEFSAFSAEVVSTIRAKSFETERIPVMANEEMRQATLQVLQLSQNAPHGTPGPQSWGGSQDGAELVTFQQDDGFYGYLRGVTQANFWEQEDQGPFETREEVEAELREQYAHPE
jgi:hypothetical protein